jgi:hypothetical protein
LFDGTQSYFRPFATLIAQKDFPFNYPDRANALHCFAGNKDYEIDRRSCGLGVCVFESEQAHVVA